MKEFLSRFDTIPEMLELDHLTVSGDVTFGKNVSLKASTTHKRERRERDGRRADGGGVGESGILSCTVPFPFSVQLQGTVIVIANHGDRIDIPTGAVLENKIVSGNLRILDH